MSIEMQHQIRRNGMDIRNFIQDLNNWKIDSLEESSTENRKKIKKQNEINEFPVRGKVVEIKDTHQAEETNLLRDKTDMNEYYQGWDKFDVVRFFYNYFEYSELRFEFNEVK